MKTTEEYKGFKIKIERDDYPRNPFEEDDFCGPLITSNSGYITDYSKNDINFYLEETITDGQIIHHQKDISEAANIDLEDYEDRGSDLIDNIRYEVQNSTNFDLLVLISQITKTPYLNTSSRGYSQGDCIQVFTCYTKEFEKVTGVTKKQVDEDFLKNNVDLLGFWAWGDVYMFEIEEIEDSCGGFYGDNHEKSGLMEMARDSIDCEVKRRRDNKANKLKKLIKSKVPLLYRQEKLAM